MMVFLLTVACIGIIICMVSLVYIIVELPKTKLPSYPINRSCEICSCSRESKLDEREISELCDLLRPQGASAMTANAAAYQLTDAETSSDIKQANINTVAGALTLACDLIEDVNLGKVLSAVELEFVAHCRELAAGGSQ